MRFIWIFFMLMGVWFIASAATENGLLPSGHAVGRVAELIVGILLIVYGIFRLRRT